MKGRKDFKLYVVSLDGCNPKIPHRSVDKPGAQGISLLGSMHATNVLGTLSLQDDFLRAVLALTA